MRKFTSFFALLMAIMLSATMTNAQQKETVQVPMSPENGRAVGDDVTNPMIVDQADLPFDEANSTCDHGNVYEETEMEYYDGGEDFFYQLNLTETTSVKITVDPSDSWTGVGLFQGNDPNAATFIATEDGSSSDARVIEEELDAGSYFVMIDSWPSPDCYDYDISIEAFVEAYPPQNLTAAVDESAAPGNAIINLSWEAGANAPEDVENYVVYRKPEGGSYSQIATPESSTYTDEDLDDNETYIYKVAAVTVSDESEASDEEIITAFVEPGFAMNPESHNFDEAGILNGEIYYDAENQTFTVTNEGVDTLTITQEPYFFSGDTADYSVVLEEGTSFPYEIVGPSETTGDSFTFEVKFEPEDVGSSNTLLVVEDDLNREIRTFSLSGSAYEIPDYDLVENAKVIDQDWNINFDYAVEETSFEGYYNDYDLTSTDYNDVVYKTTVDKDSYLTFEDASGVEDFAVFAEGDSIIEDNNLYEDGETAIGPGTYYFVVSGDGEYNFNIHIEGQEPELVVEPTEMNLGEVPIGAWHQGGTFKIYNAGGQSLTINDVTTSDENDVFTVEGHYEYPYEVTTDTMFLTVYCDADTEGSFEGALLVEDTQTTHIYDITASTYQPVEGDVVETAYDVEFNGDGHYENSASVSAPPMHNNYELETENVTDVVYSFAVGTDVLLDASLSDVTNFNGYMKLYSMNEARAMNPENLEPVAEGESFDQLEVWQGEYLLVLRGNPANPNYTLNLDIADMPNPGDITLDVPEDGAEDIELNTMLEWTLGDYTSHVDVYLDTQYPPQTKVLDSVQSVESYEPETLGPQQVYFWKVVAHNQNGSTESETYTFTTILPEPLFVTGEIFDFTNVHLEWNSPFNSVMSWTKDFEEGEMPEGWTTETNATGSTAGWFVTDEGSSSYFDIPPHTYYAVANDDAGGSGSDGSMDYMITSEQDFSQADSVKLVFDSYYTGAYDHKATVELSTDGGENWEVVHEVESQDTWANGYEVDLSEYATDDYSSVWIGFHSDDQGGWASGWAVDNVTLEREFDTPYGDNRSFVGYNIYQDGDKLNDDVYTETEYDVMDLDAGSYEFGVSAVYDEGESDIVTIDEITIDGEGTIEGQVVDADSDEGIEGATITMAANDTLIDNYTVNTDADGNYSKVVPVLDGGYNVTASASEYQDVTEEQVDVTAASATTVDFTLGETPLPVTNVVAEKGENDEQVTVTWEEVSGYPTYEMAWDDGEPENATGWTAGNEGSMNAVKFTPQGYPATVNTAKIHIYDGTWPSNDVLNPMEVVVLDDDGANGMPGTELGVVEVTPESPQWVTIDLSSLNITIEEGSFYIANRQITPEPNFPPIAIDETNPQGLSYSKVVGESWSTADYDHFMIRAIVAGPQGQQMINYDGETVAIDETVNDAAISMNPVGNASGEYETSEPTITQVAPAQENDDRELQHFEVYRYNTNDNDDMDEWTLLADDVTNTEYVDNSWSDVEMGTYKYAVKAIYTVTEAEPVSSNMVAKDMLANVVVIVDLNTGDSPEGATVTFENVNMPDTTYERTVPANGTVNINNFWKGTYNLTISKENYNTYSEENIEILESDFIRSITLEETLAAPEELSGETDCQDVHLTWSEGSGGGGTTGDEFTEDFESGVPSDWTFVDEDGDGYNWELSEEFEAHSGTNVMYSASYLNDVGALTPDNYMITPELQVGSNSQLSFWYIAQDPDFPGDKVKVKVSTTDNDPSSFTETVATVTAGASYEEQVIDMSSFAGETVYVAFNHTESNDLFYINIDDIAMSNAQRVNEAGDYLAETSEAAPIRTSGMSQSEIDEALANYESTQRTSRSLMGYNVYRNDELLTDEPISETEYTDEDMQGGTYSYKVNAVYSTGESNFAGPVEITVANIITPENLEANKTSFNNVELEWDAIQEDGLVGYHLYRNDEQLNDGEILTENNYVDYDVDYPQVYDYYVVAEYGNGCLSDTSNIETISFGTGVDDNKAENIAIYPNPASDIAKMEVTSNVKQLRVMNSLGQVVYTADVLSSDVKKVNVSDYEAGTYIVQFTTDDGAVINKRFIVVE